MSEYSLSTTSPFLKGLNTELNKLVDSTEYTNEELNCMIRANNTRSRRPGIDYEELYKFNNEYLDLSLPDLAFQCIEWTDINSPDEAETYTGYPYIVCQVGGSVIFFRNQGQPYSGHQETFTLNLLGYALDPTTDEYMRKRCKFTAAYGCIFITSEAIRPIYLRTAQDTSEVPAPVTSYASATFSVAYYNGETLSGPARPYARSNTTMKLNGVTVCEVPAYDGYAPCSTQMAAAWNAVPAATRLNITATPKYTDGVPVREGISSASKGLITAGEGGYPSDSITFTAAAPHMEGNFIEIYTSITVIGVRYTSMGSSHFGPSISTPQEYYTYTGIGFSGTLAGGSNYTYQSQLTLAIRDTYVGANDFLGVADNPTKMSYAHLYNLLNQGWTPKLIADYYNAQSPKSFPGNNLAQQFLKDDKTTAFKPTAAINMTFGNSPAARGHEVLQYFDQRRTYQSNLVSAFGQLVSSIGGGVTFNNIVDTSWTLADPTQANEADALTQVPNVKPRKPYVVDICAYAGRIFYLSGDVLLYSQVIAEDITRADKCYTEADPTGEEISDVIETDGGLISLPDVGEGLKLQVVGDSLLVFGTRGNMMISGTANNIFTATAYSAGAVSTVPTQAPDSFVSTEYGVFYWGVTGIVALGMGEQGGVQSKDLTTDKILTFYGKLTNGQHKACKGIYSASKKKIYWFYPSDDALPRRLDMCLVYDIQRDAFCPQQIVAGNGIPEVVGGLQLKVPFKSYKEYPVYANIGDPDIVTPLGGCAYNGSSYFYYDLPATADTEVYSDIEHSTSIGTVQDLLDDSQHQWSFWKCSTTVIDDKGVDTVMAVINPYDAGSVCFDYTVVDETYPLLPAGTIVYEDLKKTLPSYLTYDYTFVNMIDLDSINNTDMTRTMVVYTGRQIGDVEVVADDGYKILADTPLDTEEFNYESSILLCLDPKEAKVTFGDFRNNYMRDWAEGDKAGDGYEFKSYMVSHPVNSQDFVRAKTMPYLFSYFKRTETGKTVNGSYIYPSHCQGSVRWDWRTDGVNGKWDSPNELYRFRDRTLLSQGYVTNKTNIRGIGRAFQIKLEGIRDDNFIVEALGFNLCKDERI